MSKIPEEVMGNEQNELGAKKPDFGIFEKLQKELDDTVDAINAKADTAAGKMQETAKAAVDRSEVNVEKIMDSRTRRSMMSDTMEVKPIVDEAAEAAGKTVEKAAAPVEDVKDTATGVAEETADKAAGAAEDVKETAADAVDGAEEAAADTVETVRDAAGEAADGAEAAVDDAADKASDALGKAEDAAEGIAEKAEETAAGAAGEAKDALAGIAGKADDAAAKTADEIPSDPREVLKGKIETAKRRKGWHVLLIEAVVIVLAVVITFTLILGSSTVKGTSMEPNFFEGDRVLYFKMASNFEQNDVIIFHTEENRDLIKRVIAVEGDVVDIDDGEVLVNGTPVESLNVSQETEESVSGVSDPVDFPLTVEADHVFVLGDNRSVSIDSRTKKIGLIDKDDIAGRVFYLMRGKMK
ncbi:MAG: signal peptidase I [Bacillota bacterium]|nr:signal peptidase I [Bacillota bacterium]